MKSTFLAIVFLVLDTTAKADEVQCVERKSRIGPKSIGEEEVTTYVVNHEFCSSEDVLSYAELKNDPHADLPSSFTICSSAMTTYGSMQTFFTLVGKDGNSWLAPLLRVNGRKTFFFEERWSDVKLPPFFAHQWAKSCIAVNSESDLLQWVVDGTLVENATVHQVKDIKSKPTDLTGKIILGATQAFGPKWKSNYKSNQVTNLNIFSTALTIGEMQQNTMGGNCSAEGDYLAWKDMQWSLRGEAIIETVEEKELCMGHPSFNLYPGLYSSMETCKQFCYKLGSRSPSAATLQQWKNLQMILEGRKEPKDVTIWLALYDTNTEGEWMDYYNHKG